MNLKTLFSIVVALVCTAGISPAFTQNVRANGETLNVQTFPGATLSIHAIIAEKKGFCKKYNFTCELRPIANGTVALQSLIGKTVDVAMIGTEMIANAVAEGADLKEVSMPIPNVPQILVVRNDVAVPSVSQGYPAMIKDLKGLKVGVPARGSQGEIWLTAMLKDAGLKASDVTIVAVGGPATAYTSLVASKQVDAVVVFEPIKQLCVFEKKCKALLDLSHGEGPTVVKQVNGAAAPYVMRGETVKSQAMLAAAFNAAMIDAANWIHEPANFDELLKILTPMLGYSDLPNYQEFLQMWLKAQLPQFSKDMKIDRKAVAATINFYRDEAKLIRKPVTVEQIVWDAAP